MTTKDEIATFLNRVKGYYQDFSLNSSVLKLWYEELKNYELIDIYNVFEDYLKSDYKDRPPKIHFLKKHLLTKKQKDGLKNIRVRCPNCNRIVPYENIVEHGARCSAIKYIKSREDLLNNSYNEDKLFNANKLEFDNFYNSFLKRIEPLVTRPDERERIIQICNQLN